MSTVLTELFRHSFPKGLRFCGQCKSLHSSLTVVIKRNKNRRYINKAEIDAVAASFTPAPYAWMRNPIIKRLLILNVVNQIRRGVYKKPFWMLSNSIETEHDKLQQWLKLYEECGGNMHGVTATGDASEKTTGSGSTRGFSVDRGFDTSKSSASPSSSSGSGASSTPFATNAPALKRGKWSASKYMRNTEGKGEKDSANASAGASTTKSTPAPVSSVPAKSDKRLAADLGSTKGIAADLAEEANRSAAPEAREGKASFSSALRQVFGGGGPSSSSAEPAAATSSSSSAGSAASSSKKDASSSTKAGASSSSPSGSQGAPQWTNTNRNAKDFIEREVFEKSFMGNFHVAMYYHLSFICGVAIVLCCLIELFCIFFAHHIFYANERMRGRASTVDDIVETHIDIEEKHLTVEVPPEFQSRLPPPAVVMKASDAPKRRLELSKDDDGYIPRPPTPQDEVKNTASDKDKAVAVAPKRRIVDPRTGKALDVVEGNNKITDSAIKEVGTDDASDVYVLNAVELTSPNGKIKVVFIPSPVVAPEGFYKEQGAILKNADVVLLEGVALTDTHRQPASTFFPLHDNFFKPYGLSHRYYDVLTSGREPPMLLPAAIPTSWGRWLQLLVIPFPFVAIHRPELMVGSKGEARVGWSWLLDTLDMVADMDTSAGPQHPKLGGGGGGGNNGSKVFEDNVTGVMAPASHAGLALKSGSAVVAIPWTVNQIANVEASLLNRGFTVTGVLPIRWMERGQFGRAFADYFNVKEGNSGPVRTSSTETADAV